jgi:hypothetical protein
MTCTNPTNIVRKNEAIPFDKVLMILETFSDNIIHVI